MKSIISIAFAGIAYSALAQNFSETTNAIRVNFNQSSEAGPLPAIAWITPRIERSNSIERTVTFQAEVESEVELKSIVMELTAGGKAPILKQIPLDQNHFKKSISIPVNLMDGENVIKLVAENIKGGVVSSARSVLTG